MGAGRLNSPRAKPQTSAHKTVAQTIANEFCPSNLSFTHRGFDLVPVLGRQENFHSVFTV